MHKTNDLVTQQFASLRNKLSALSYGLNRNVIIEGGELNALRREAGETLSLLNSVEVLVTQTKHEQNAVRAELDNIGGQIALLVNQMNPDFLATDKPFTKAESTSWRDAGTETKEDPRGTADRSEY